MTTYDSAQIIAAIQRVIDRVLSMKDELNDLDRAMGDGDTDISALKAAAGLRDFLATGPATDDLGQFFFNAGRAINAAASSTLGTVTAIGVMRSGKAATGRQTLDLAALSAMLAAANQGIQERGKAKPGDKTIVDALHPAAGALAQAVADGRSAGEAGAATLEAARAGRDAAKALRSQMGRGSWVGERSENQLDPGTVLFVGILEAIIG